jgi:hypothetical protein
MATIERKSSSSPAQVSPERIAQTETDNPTCPLCRIRKAEVELIRIVRRRLKGGILR